MERTIINPALSLLMKHLVIGQRQKAPNFSAFHWSPHGSLVSIGQQFVTTRLVHLPKRTETRFITEADLITESDQAVRAVHSCNSWLLAIISVCSFLLTSYFVHFFLLNVRPFLDDIFIIHKFTVLVFY